MSTEETRPVIGWREWLRLPGLEIGQIKAKVDTGARTSALHATFVTIGEHDGIRLVEFGVQPRQQSGSGLVEVVAELVDERPVRNSGGISELRPVVLMDVGLGTETWTIEVTLTRRDDMGFRMLLGRQAIRGRFCVDPARSFLASGKPQRTTTKKRRKRIKR